MENYFYEIFVDKDCILDPTKTPIIRIEKHGEMCRIVYFESESERRSLCCTIKNGEIVQDPHLTQSWTFLKPKNARRFFLKELYRVYEDPSEVYNRLKETILYKSVLLEEL